MNRFVDISLILAVAFAIVCSCSGVPDGVLDKEEMARLVADIHIGEGVVESNPSAFPNDSTKRALRQSIYARHGLTSDQADASFRWYGYNMEKYVEVYDRALEMLDEDMQFAQEQLGSSSPGAATTGYLALEGDSVDVWNDIRFRPFSPTLPSNLISFNLKSDPNWEKGDIYTFRSKMQGNSRTARLIVGINYADGTFDAYSRNVIGDGWHELRFALDSVKNAREVYGAFHYEAPEGEVAYIDSISLTRTRWRPGSTAGRDGVSRMHVKRHSGAVD